MNVVERQNSKARHVGFFLLLVLVLEDEILFVLFLVSLFTAACDGRKIHSFKQSSSS